jgi:ABC-type sugar transport system substrate-binding protein
MEPKRDHLALFLPDPSNDFVAAIADDAEHAARRFGFALQVHSSRNQAVEQIQQIFATLRAPAGERPDGILVMPIHDQSLERVARFALGLGIPWVCLHRATGDLAALRTEFPEVPLTLVGPEQEECGRIQGRQLLAMFPQGARVLYVHGRSDNQSTKQRAAGLREVVDGSPVKVGEMIDGNWSTADTELAVGRWLKLLIAHTHVDAVVCQNDAMAVGAMRALRDTARSMTRPGLAELPVIGCDGLAQVGRKLVDSGDLAATVVLPLPATPAIEAVRAALDGGQLPPPQIRLQPQMYPPVLARAS